MKNFDKYLINRLLETGLSRASPGGGQGAKGSTRLSGDSKGGSTENKATEGSIKAHQAMVQAYFDANPDAEGAAEHKAKGPTWVIPKKGKNKRKITNQVIVKKVSETIRGTESKAMLWLQARADKKKEADARKKAAQRIKGEGEKESFWDKEALDQYKGKPSRRNR